MPDLKTYRSKLGPIPEDASMAIRPISPDPKLSPQMRAFLAEFGHSQQGKGVR
ncbi:MAG: hypothetical protein WB611_00890 [Stellaceae bacterium]